MSVAGRMMNFQIALLPNPWNLRYATSQGQRDFADAIKWRIVWWASILDYLGGSNVITRVYKKEIREPVSEREIEDEGERERESWKCCVVGFEDGGKEAWAKGYRNLWKLEKAKKYRKNVARLTPWFVFHKPVLGLLTFRTLSSYICVAFSH